MPSEKIKKKDLYVASSVSELNKIADSVPKVVTGQCRMFVKSAEKILKEARDSELLGDEERAYVLYTKYCTIVMAIRKTPEYKKNEAYFNNVIGMKNLISSLEAAETLAANLKNRYEEREAIEVSKKLEGLSTSHNDTSSKIEDVVAADEQKTDKKEGPPKTPPPPTAAPASPTDLPGSLSVTGLYTLMTDGVTSMVLLDTRPAGQFAESHINHPNCVNVPADIVKPGTTVPHIAAALPASSRDVWQQRGNVDHVVLLDWSSSLADLQTGSTLQSLKDALYKWDRSVTLRSEPLVLQGGYEEWLLYYPTLTTNASIPRPPSYKEVTSNLPSLDSIEYDLDLEFLKTDEERAAAAAAAARRLREAEEEERGRAEKTQSEGGLPAAADTGGKSSGVPLVDRSRKPNTSKMNNSNENMNDATVNKANNSKVHIETINNNLNRKTTNLDELRRSLGEAQPSKDTNRATEERARQESPKPAPPVMPNRALKPGSKSGGKPNNSVSTSSSEHERYTTPPSAAAAAADTTAPASTASSSSDSSTSAPSTSSIAPAADDPRAAALHAIQADIAAKTREAEAVARDNQRLALEHKARAARLEKEKSELEKLRAAKSQEAAEMAGLMREKKRILAEMDELAREKRERDVEEENRQSELARMKEAETREKERLRAEAERLRRLRKEKEAAGNATTEASSVEEFYNQDHMEELAWQIAQEETKKKKAQEEARREEEKRAAEEERKKKREASEERRRRQREEAEERRRQAEAAAQRKKAEEERARLALEEQKRTDAESRKLAEELRERARREDEKRRKEVSATLPSGWERRWDKTQAKYYYINHDTKSTQWQPPSAAASSTAGSSGSPSPQHTPTPSYKARLRDEDDTPRPSQSGLSRSHSSPNIAKMMSDEDERKTHPPMSKASRFIKPIADRIPITTDISAAKVRNLQPTWGSVGPGLTGLRNLCNSCYMNSTLQCLSNTTPLAIYFLTDIYSHDINRESSKGSRGQVTEEFAALVKALWSGQYKSVTPRDFKATIGRHQSMFAGTEQQDSQELLTFFMDCLHEDLNKKRSHRQLPELDLDETDRRRGAELSWSRHTENNDSILVDIFQGQFMSTVTCEFCGKNSVTFDPFMCLSLDIPEHGRCSLRDCILAYSNIEKMTGECRWHCPRCRTKRDATKKIVIWKLPPILIIVLKRFYYNGIWRQKKTNYVDFELENLDMNQFIAGPKSRPKYNLYAVSNHYGTMEGGHYTAYCKNPKNKKWYKFDDHEVSEMSKSDIKSSAAYFLCYSSMKMEPAFV